MISIEESTHIIKKVISDVWERSSEEKGSKQTLNLSSEMRLIGDDSLLDSMNIVEICLELEDIAEENDFEFDWTSESALSKSRSMFRSVQSLADEFQKQSIIS